MRHRLKTAASSRRLWGFAGSCCVDLKLHRARGIWCAWPGTSNGFMFWQNKLRKNLYLPQNRGMLELQIDKIKTLAKLLIKI